MEEQLRRYFLGIVGFATVVVWATLGAPEAIVAALACAIAANVHRFTARRVAQRPERVRLAARPLDAEDDDLRQIVPDDPSLVISTSGWSAG